MEFIKTTNKQTDINVIKTSKFKTTRMQVVFVGELVESELASRALLPYMLKSVSKKYPKRDIMSSHLESLYATSFNVGVNKITNAHIITFDIHFINNAYTMNNEDLCNDALLFLSEVLYNPLFDEQIFIEERRLMEEYFQGIFSNKVKYAVSSLKNEMFKDDTYRLSPLGSSELLKTVTINTVKDAYNKMIQNDKVFVSVIGDVDETKLSNLVRKHLPLYSNNKLPKLIDQPNYQAVTPTLHEKIIDVKQATLVQGYQFNVLYKAHDYYAALLFNLLFGGTSESLLFKEIREKHSLVYYINSSYDPYKGVLFIYAGINAKDYDSVMDKTSSIINDVINNKIDEDTLSIAKKLLLNGIIQGMDSNHSLLGKINQSYIFEYDYNIDETIKKINDVTLPEIKEVAKKLVLDTIYMIRGDKHE